MDPKVLSKEVWERTVIRFGRERERIGRQGNRVGPTQIVILLISYHQSLCDILMIPLLRRPQTQPTMSMFIHTTSPFIYSLTYDFNVKFSTYYKLNLSFMVPLKHQNFSLLKNLTVIRIFVVVLVRLQVRIFDLETKSIISGNFFLWFLGVQGTSYRRVEFIEVRVLYNNYCLSFL